MAHLRLLFHVGVLLIAVASVKGEEWGGDECQSPLGMESGKIPSAGITATSSFDVKNVGPQSARVRNEHNGGAWCPQKTIQEGVKEFLEIDLGGDYRVTQTETQGRFGNGNGQEYAESFQLEYWRNSLGRWVSYKDHLGRTILKANTNTYVSVIQNLNPPIVTRRVRFIPYSVHPRTICMRVELYGCHYKGGVIHYECPQGYWKKNPDVDLRDGSYDGRTDDTGVLRGGLGLLTDSVLGPSDFRAMHKTKGNMWIGWNNASHPVKISFQFDRLRKFHHVGIHVNNFVSQGAQVFESVDIYLSVDGVKWSEFPLRHFPKVDLKNESAQLIFVPLKGRLSSGIRMEFVHSNHWLLLSEILFSSDIFTGNITEDIHSLNYLQDGPDDGKDENGSDVLSGSSNSGTNGAMIGLIAGSLSIFALLSIVFISCYLLRRNRRNTKLVGVIGMPPKSMSIGLSSIGDGKHKGGRGKKIQLNDLNPVSISRHRETESEESLYHELVFGLGVPGPCGSSTKSLEIPENKHTNYRKAHTNRKIKYQRVNHGGDFNDYGMRGMGDEMSFFHSGPPTPSAGLKLGTLGNSCGKDILPPPPPAYRHLQHLNSPATSMTLGPVFATSSSIANGHFHHNSPHGRSNGRLGKGLKSSSSMESNYYAATDIFQVSDKLFDRF